MKSALTHSWGWRQNPTFKHFSLLSVNAFNECCLSWKRESSFSAISCAGRRKPLAIQSLKRDIGLDPVLPVTQRCGREYNVNEPSAAFLRAIGFYVHPQPASNQVRLL